MYTRTSQQLADTIAEAQLQVVDSPLTPANAKDAISAIKAKLDALVTAGKLIGAECWFDIIDNDTTSLRQGIVRIRYKYTPFRLWSAWNSIRRLPMSSSALLLHLWEVTDGRAKKTSCVYRLCGR